MSLSLEGQPAFPCGKIEEIVREVYGIDGKAKSLPAEWDQNFTLTTPDGSRYVVKIANRGRGIEELEFQNEVMLRLSQFWGAGKAPRVLESLAGERISRIPGPAGETFLMRVLTYLHGKPLGTVPGLNEAALGQLGGAIGELDRCLLDFEHPGMDHDSRWDLGKASWISAHTGQIADVEGRGIVERLLVQYLGRVKHLLDDLPVSVIHNDANDENILLVEDPEVGWRITGLIDYGDSTRSQTVNELAVLCAYAILRSDNPLGVIKPLVAGYHQVRPLSELEIQLLFPLICMRLCVSVTMSAIAAKEDPENEHRQISDRLAWGMLGKLEPLDWRAAENEIRESCGLERRTLAEDGGQELSMVELLERRRRAIGPSLSLSYQTPLVILRGRQQYLFDSNGTAYLDCVNNICHVGHSHPKVVAALSDQAAILNTNTRYLHPNILAFAERLTATLPEPLRVCYFVNSGSEANELALRLARAHTGREDVIVIDHSYHGNTQTLIDLSPYKCEGPGGRGLAPWAHKVVLPDPYRGPHRGTGEETGRLYAAHVGELCQRLVAERRPPAVFLCESIPGVGGQIVFPDGYLGAAFTHVRAVGGVCAVDEVQVGMGRVGSHMWAFENQGVVPDIVTVGKPIGNGHPLGAVVTTPEIARSFDNGMEYFNSFGGNPVSMAVGMAVLDVIEEEGLRELALRVGGYLMRGFRLLAGRHPEIGDVRGLGLFIGVELVQDRESRAPATELTASLVEAVKADGILLSAEGPDHNVLKIKPPMQFTETDADLLLSAVDRHLTSMRKWAV